MEEIAVGRADSTCWGIGCCTKNLKLRLCSFMTNVLLCQVARQWKSLRCADLLLLTDQTTRSLLCHQTKGTLGQISVTSDVRLRSCPTALSTTCLTFNQIGTLLCCGVTRRVYLTREKVQVTCAKCEAEGEGGWIGFTGMKTKAQGIYPISTTSHRLQYIK